MKTEREAILATIFITACWGISFVFTKWALEEMDPYTFLSLRFSIASLLFAVLFCTKLKYFSKATLKAGILVGCMLAAAMGLQTEGLQLTTASNSALITGLYLVFTPLYLAVTKKEMIQRYAFAGAITAFAGLYLLTQYNFQAANFGDFLTLICSFACVGHILTTDHTSRRHQLIPLVLVQFITVAVIMGLIAFFTQHPTFHYSHKAWGNIFFTAIFSTIIAFSIQVAAQRILDPTRAGILFALEAVFGALFGWWLAGETMSSTAFAGACLMVGGMLIAESKPVVQFMRSKLSF